jgi:hypothetical protein
MTMASGKILHSNITLHLAGRPGTALAIGGRIYRRGRTRASQGHARPASR